MDLPHHVSSIQMIDGLMESLKITVSALPRPTLVTVARYGVRVSNRNSVPNMLNSQFDRFG